MKWDTELEKIGAKTKYPIGDGDHGYIKPEMYQKNGVPYIRVGDITWSGSIDRSKMVYISEEINNANPKSFLYPGDIVISKTGATIGKVAVIPDDMPISNTTSSIGKISLDKSKANSKYVVWCMRSQNFQTQMWRVSHKSAQPGFNIQDLKKFKIPLPPLATQQKIAAILDAADELRQKDKALVAKYDELTQALFLDMFGDPVTNPKGWEKLSIMNFCEFENGDRSSNYPSGNDIKSSGKLFLSSGDIKKGRFVVKDSKFISDNKYISLKRGKCYRNDILMTLRGNGTGKTAIFDCEYEEGFINAQMVIIRPNEKCEPNYLVLQLNHPVVFNNLIKLNTGSAQPQLSAQSVKEFEVFLPPIKLQNQFAERVKAIEEQKSIAQASALKSEELFNSLLQKAFNGELL
jgi:type I restriction enzyme S subunit